MGRKKKKTRGTGGSLRQRPLCGRKVIYASEKDANRGRMNLWGSDPSADLNDLHVYPCWKPNDQGKQVKHFHVGHLSKFNELVDKGIIDENCNKPTPRQLKSRNRAKAWQESKHLEVKSEK